MSASAWNAFHVRDLFHKRWESLEEGEHQLELGNFPEAKRLLSRAAAEAAQRNVTWKTRIHVMLGLSRAQWRLHELEQARKTLEEALQLLPNGLLEASTEQAQCLEQLGCISLDEGDFDWAAKLLEKAIEAETGLRKPDAAAQLSRHVHLARAYRLAGKSFAAAVHLDRALEWFEAAPESDGMTAAAVHFEKAAVEREQGRRREAISSLRQALELHQELAGRDSEVVARDYELMAVISRELGDLPQAIQCYERALYILERLVGSNEAEHAELKMTLAETQLDAGHEAVAIELMQQAAAHLECVDDERYPRALETLAAVCSLCGRYHEAIDHLRRARKAWGRVPGDHAADLASNAEAVDAVKKHLPPEETTPVPLEAIFKSDPPPAPEKSLAG